MKNEENYFMNLFIYIQLLTWKSIIFQKLIIQLKIFLKVKKFKANKQIQLLLFKPVEMHVFILCINFFYDNKK